MAIIFDPNEDLGGDGYFDMGEDINANGLLDEGEDVDGDGLLDLNEDLDEDGHFDVDEDLNGNGVTVRRRHRRTAASITMRTSMAIPTLMSAKMAFRRTAGSG